MRVINYTQFPYLQGVYYFRMLYEFSLGTGRVPVPGKLHEFFLGTGCVPFPGKLHEFSLQTDINSGRTISSYTLQFCLLYSKEIVTF